ncbi:DUF4446 family protein [Nocardioides sp.]|uniref:DUF4446 family protein n=1 Tax=Nocardioides sp. TaxID=35761 RepID=UPI0039E4F635
MLALALLSLATAIVALVLAGAAWRARATYDGPEPLPADVLGLRQEVAALAAESRSAIRHLAVVRYDAFGDMGGQLSWSVALLDADGNGMVLTSIHGRSEARGYAKAVTGWKSEAQLSPEEAEAIATARPKR